MRLAPITPPYKARRLQRDLEAVPARRSPSETPMHVLLTAASLRPRTPRSSTVVSRVLFWLLRR